MPMMWKYKLSGRYKHLRAGIKIYRGNWKVIQDLFHTKRFRPSYLYALLLLLCALSLSKYLIMHHRLICWNCNVHCKFVSNSHCKKIFFKWAQGFSKGHQYLCYLEIIAVTFFFLTRNRIAWFSLGSLNIFQQNHQIVLWRGFNCSYAYKTIRKVLESIPFHFVKLVSYCYKIWQRQ